MKALLTIEIEGQCPITLSKTAGRRDPFSVTYGKQTKEHLNYYAAGHELGLAAMHAISCTGKLDQ